MRSLLKAEFRKLFTVRSTYVITALACAFVAFFAFYIEGIRGAATVGDPQKLASEVIGAVSTVSIFCALIAVLLMAHEYRYNTIMYTLTASKSRSKVLIAKIVAISVFALGFTLFIGVFSPLMTSLGLHLKGLTLAPQTLDYWSLLWRSVFFGWSYAMVGLLLAALFRNQIGAILALFLVPVTAEPLLSLLLKENMVYLPFMAMRAVMEPVENLSYAHAAAVFALYLGSGWLVAWVLFLRRDAN